jgi:hypothetical protein
MESTKMNEALIANPALPTATKDTLLANSALQATGMKDDDGFLSVSIDLLLFHPTSVSSYVCRHCHCHRFHDTRYLFDVAFFFVMLLFDASSLCFFVMLLHYASS